MKRLVIAGGGFAGFWAAAAAARLRRDTAALASLEILLVSRDDQLVIRPRLYEPDPAGMSVALAPRLDAIGVEFRQGEVTSIDVAGSLVQMADGSVSYSKLVLAAGSQLARPAGPIGSHGFDLGFDIDTLEGAAKLDRHLHELAAGPENEGRWTVVIAGGGFTGIELATALPQRLRALAGSAAIRVLVVDQADRMGASLGDGPKSSIHDALAAAGIEVRTGATIADADSTGVILSTGERIACQTLLWTTGMRASPLAAKIAGQISAQTDALGRIAVSPELRVAGANDIFAAGDVAHAIASDGHAILQSCQHAQVTGRFAGHNAAADLAGVPLQAYCQPVYTTCLDLGNSGAVLTTGWERTVQATGDKAKTIKRHINTQLIYPPLERDAILAAAAPSIMDEETFRRRILGNPATPAASTV
jgi:NADH:ubiquinone reductase (H+-translocating)